MQAKLEGRAPMPFVAETPVAADKFCRAIARGTRKVAWPYAHAIPARMMRWIPAPIFEPLAQRASRPQVALAEEIAAKKASAS